MSVLVLCVLVGLLLLSSVFFVCSGGPDLLLRIIIIIAAPPLLVFHACASTRPFVKPQSSCGHHAGRIGACCKNVDRRARDAHITGSDRSLPSRDPVTLSLSRCKISFAQQVQLTLNGRMSDDREGTVRDERELNNQFVLIFARVQRDGMGGAAWATKGCQHSKAAIHC